MTLANNPVVTNVYQMLSHVGQNLVVKWEAKRFAGVLDYFLVGNWACQISGDSCQMCFESS